MSKSKVDLSGTIDKPIARSYEAEKALRDNLTGAVEMKKPIPATVPMDRIYIPKPALDKVKMDNAQLPANPTVKTNGPDKLDYLNATTLAKVEEENARLPKTPMIKKGTPDKIDYDVRITDIPEPAGE